VNGVSPTRSNAPGIASAFVKSSVNSSCGMMIPNPSREEGARRGLARNAGHQDAHQAHSNFGASPSNWASVRPSLSRADISGASLPHLMPNF